MWERLKILFVYGTWIPLSLKFTSDISVEEMQENQWGWVEVLSRGEKRGQTYLLAHDKLRAGSEITPTRLAHMVFRKNGRYYVVPRPGWRPRMDLAPVSPDHPAWKWLEVHNPLGF